MVDLEAYLQENSPELFKKYNEIVGACKELWRDVQMKWYTDHSPTHSVRLVRRLDEMLAPLDGTKYFPTPTECFILLASCYLHDIGMQDMRVGGKDVEELTKEDRELVRREHAQRTFDMIREGVLRPKGVDSVDLRIEGEEGWCRALMWVCKAHSTRYFREVVDYLRADPLVVQDEQLRGDFLCALLMMADELDLTADRVSFCEAKLMSLSPDCRLHWFTHYYVYRVAIPDQAITITFRVHKDVEKHAELLKRRVAAKLDSQLKLCNPIFKEATGGVLALTVEEPPVAVDIEGVKREMPEEVLVLLKQEAGDAASESADPRNEREVPVQFRPPNPTPLFTGRADELKMVEELVSSWPVSMITGLGGTGKSELVAKYVAEQTRFAAHGVYWFDLGERHTPDLLAAALESGDMLGREQASSQEKGVNLADALERSSCLVVIDNAHQLTDPVLAAAVRFAASHLDASRILLVGKSRPEVVTELEPRVAVKGINGLDTDGPEYARKLRHEWHVVVDDGDIARMCDAVENHPMAIEIAFKILRSEGKPADVVREIVEHSRTSSGSEDLSKRLLSVLYGRAHESERYLAYRLSVFRKPFPKEAVSFVARDAEVSSQISGLVDKLMLRFDGKVFRMHQLVRAFCYGELHDKCAAHSGAAEYYESLRGDTADIGLESEVVHHAVQAGNTGEAVGVLVEHGTDMLIRGHSSGLLAMLAEVEGAGGLADKLLNLRGRLYDSLGEPDLAMADLAIAERSADVECRAEALYRRGMIHYNRGETRESKAVLQSSLALAEAHGAKRIIAYATDGLGHVAMREGYLQHAMDRFCAARERLRALGPEYARDVAMATTNMVGVLMRQGELVAAKARCEESLSALTEIGARQDAASCLIWIGSILNEHGDLRGAMARFKESLAVHQALGARAGTAACLYHIGAVLRQQGDWEGAIAKAEESLALYRDIGNRTGIGDCLNGIGLALSTKGDLQGALEKYEESLATYQESGSKTEIATCFNNMGAAYLARGDIAAAIDCARKACTAYGDTGALGHLAVALRNLSRIYTEAGQHPSALHTLLEADALFRKLRNEREIEETARRMWAIRRTIGISEFRRMAEAGYSALAEDLNPHSGYPQYIGDETVHVQKVGRNDPCPCGSGKKYKRCCLGKNG